MTAVDPAGSATVGRYRLVQRLGEGGMGVVYLGVDQDGHAAAVKILRTHVAADAQARRRLEREVRTLRRLHHPRIAEVLDAELTSEAPYLVTQFVPGKTLDQLVQDHGPLDLDDVLKLGRGLAEALEAIHAAGIVHRDLKPANVMMVETDPVVIDFGIAHLVDESRITVTGLVMGTPGYLSPEVIEGMAVTDATDWWGWAATMAYATTGRPPFGIGPTEVVLDRVRRGRADLDGVPRPLDSLLASVLTVEASDRRTGAQIRQWLEAAVTPSMAEATTVRYPAPSGSVEGRTVASPPPGHDSSEDVTVRYPAPPGTGLEPTLRYPAPTAGPPATSLDRAPAVPPLASPAGAASPVPAQQPVAWPPAHSSRYSGAERPIVVPPKPYSAPPNVSAGPVPAGTVPGQGPAGGPQTQTGQPPGPLRPTGTLLLAALTVAGVAAVAPGGAVVVTFVLMVLARTVDRSATSMWRRRSAAGPRAGDIPIAVVSLPWQVILAAASSVLSFILPVPVAVSVAFIVGTSLTPDIATGPSSPVALAVAAFAGVITAWWGPGGGSFRRGSRTAARSAISSTTGRLITWSLLVLVVVAAALVAAQGEPVDWAPFPSPGAVFLVER